MNILFTRNKFRICVAAATGLLYLLLLLFVQGMNLNLPVWCVAVVMGISAAVVIGLSLWEITLPESYQKKLTVFFLFVAPAISFATVEFLQKGFNHVHMGKLAIFFNYLFYLAVYLILYLLTNRIRITVLVGSLLFFVLGLVNHYMIILRMSPFQPWDILAVQTAADVLPELKFELDATILFSLAATAVFCALIMQIRYVNRKKKSRLIFAGVQMVLITACLSGFFLVLSPNMRGIMLDSWDTIKSSQTSGFVAHFYLNLKKTHISSPEGYSPQAAEDIIKQNQIQAEAQSVEKKPNIIVIMNESFADMNVLGDVESQTEIMPFVSSLKENTKKGDLIVPVYGGGTCNTEYEFLTGNVSALLRDVPGIYPMQQYVTAPSPSIPYTLKAQGYNTIGIHPCPGRNWNRDTAYPLLGLDKFLTIDDFQGSKYIRSVVSDEACYDKVKEVYEQKGDDPVFIFNVTMQNHGGYNQAWENMTEDAVAFKDRDKYPDAAQYFSLIRESDRQIQNLVEYFEQQSDPTVIVFFGDHQPALEDGFLQALVDKSGLDEREKAVALHTVPFFIWTNYDIDEEELGQLSPNYLSSILLQTAGLQMTDYNKYLLWLHEKLPVLSPIICVNDKGEEFNMLEAPSSYQSIIDNYRMVLYNQVFDTKNQKKELFALPDDGS